MTYPTMPPGTEMQLNHPKPLKPARKKTPILTRVSRNKAKIARVTRRIILRPQQAATPLENIKIYIKKKKIN